MTGKEKLLAIYLALDIPANTLLLLGTGYAVFERGASGWWFLLAVLCCLPSSAVIKYCTGIDIYR